MTDLGTGRRGSDIAQPVLALYALVGGLTSFIGYYADVPRLADWLNSGISIQPNAAIAVMCASLALLLLKAGHRYVAVVFGVLVFAIGSTVLVEIATGIDFGIDGLFLFGREWGRTGVVVPGRMGPPGAASWMMLGLALVFASAARTDRLRAIAPLLALLAVGIASLSLIGYLYGVTILYALPTVTVIALQTSTFVLAIAIGVMLTLPEQAPMRLLDDTSPAGALARRILPVVIVLPIVLGLLRLYGERAGFFDLALGTASRTLAEILLMLAFLWWAASTIGKQAHARRQAEEQLVESLREADRRKNEFLATLAHELRNPLSPIRNAVAVMKLKKPDDPTLARASDVIDRQVVLMARLLDDLLDIGRITSDKLELRKECVDLEVVVRDAVEMCRPLIQQYDHDVAVEATPPAIHLDADPARLGQVFGNLVNNACKYTARNGRIRVTLARGATEAIVKVSDTGIGISPDQRSSIFEMFSQIDHASNRPQAGLGIGLHLVKRLVEMHGGTIDVESEGPGHGSTFIVRLPALPEQTARDVTEAASPSMLTTPAHVRRVLVVDDNADHAETLATLLSIGGHDVHTAHDGAEALAAAERLRPDAILLDLGLPLVNGFDACRRLREQPWGKDALVIAISGWGQEVDRQRSTEAGFNHHLVKPIDARAIATLLASAPAPSDSSVRSAF
ncbi:MAG TPA: ATP-binding protein [Vicinamibacterales bacterium]|jgi:signal transduction histidine kinase/ActR/RegA family two-component response regulator